MANVGTLGITFAPGSNNNDPTVRRGGDPLGVSGPIQLFQLRNPRFFGAGAPAPAPLLQSGGGVAGFDPGILRRLLSAIGLTAAAMPQQSIGLTAAAVPQQSIAQLATYSPLQAPPASLPSLNYVEGPAVPRSEYMDNLPRPAQPPETGNGLPPGFGGRFGKAQ